MYTCKPQPGDPHSPEFPVARRTPTDSCLSYWSQLPAPTVAMKLIFALALFSVAGEGTCSSLNRAQSGCTGPPEERGGNLGLQAGCPGAVALLPPPTAAASRPGQLHPPSLHLLTHLRGCMMRTDAAYASFLPSSSQPCATEQCPPGCPTSCTTAGCTPSPAAHAGYPNRTPPQDSPTVPTTAPRAGIVYQLKVVGKEKCPRQSEHTGGALPRTLLASLPASSATVPACCALHTLHAYHIRMLRCSIVLRRLPDLPVL